jgi:hypothetical protein
MESTPENTSSGSESINRLVLAESVYGYTTKILHWD